MTTQFIFPGFGAEPAPIPLPKLQPGQVPRYRLFLGLFPQSQEASSILERIHALRHLNGLRGKPLRVERLHVTLHSLGDSFEKPPVSLIDAVKSAVSGVAQPPIDLTFDRAMSFVKSNAFVLCGDGNEDVKLFVQKLGRALKGAALHSHPSLKPHMTMLYDKHPIPEQQIEPIRWKAHEFVLVLSHLGMTRHDWLVKWPLL